MINGTLKIYMMIKYEQSSIGLFGANVIIFDCSKIYINAKMAKFKEPILNIEYGLHI